MKKVMKIILKSLSFIGVFLVILLVTVYSMGLLICYGPSKHAKNLFVTTFLETGQMKFVVSLFMSKDEIQAVVDSNSMTTFDEEMDNSLINIDNTDSSDIELVEVSGNTYYGKMIIVKDPSRVKLATIYDGSWKEYGVTLDKLVNDNNAIAGINGGLYYSDSNKGGRPLGLVVRDGKIEYNNPSGLAGLYLIGFNEDNLLKIIDLNGKNAKAVEKIIKDEKIRDAVAFQEATLDKTA